MYKKETDGYFSVEASFLLPMIIIVLWFLIIMGFYLYNLCAMYRISFSTSLKGINMENDAKGQMTEKLEEFILKSTEERLLMMEKVEFDIKVSKKDVEVIIWGKMRIPVLTMLSDTFDIWEIKSKSLRSRENPVKFIRTIRK